MGGGIYFSFNVGRAGASAANLRYITRETAIDGNLESIFVQNYPEYVQEGESYKDKRNNLAEYVRQKEEDELKKPKRGKGEVQTHYRAVASFESKIGTEKAREMAKQYLEERFPKARAIAVVHQDTKHTHIHFHIQARDDEDRKLRFKQNEWKELDKEWNKIYGREFGREKQQQHLDKKAETREWKKSLVKGEEKEKPHRVNTNNKQMYLDRDKRNAGFYELNKDRDGRDKSRFADGNKTIDKAARNPQEREPDIAAGKQAVNQLFDKSQRANEQFNKTESAVRELSNREKQANQQLSRTESEARTTIHETERLRDELKGLGKELSKEIDRDKDKYRCR